jgi:hypothetical protein
MDHTLVELISKRFIGLLVCVPALMIGYFFGPRPEFGEFVTALGGMYVAYTAGQSYTDAKEVK